MKILLPLLLATSLASAGDDLKSADLAKLANPATRGVEVARLTNNNSSYILTQVRLLTAPQRNDAPPLHVLCVSQKYRSSLRSSLFGDYEIEKPEELFDTASLTIPFRSEPDLDPVRDSVLMVFDSKGREIRPFGGDNCTDKGYFFDFDHDGILDRADFTNYSVEEAPKDSVTVFELKSIEPKPRTLLRVIFNWHPESAPNSNDWGFTCFDDNKDGIAEIAFGPASATKAKDQRKFIFRWDPATKCYSAGEIPPHSHIRVMKPDETLASIARSGALGYPVIQDSSKSDDEKPAPQSTTRPHYVFQSFKDRPAAELAAFFQGKKHRDHFDDPEDAVPSSLPENLWDLPPKQAALAIAEANRTPTHRERWKLAIDDRHGIAPPGSGWLVHDWGSSGCYSFSSHLFALRFGVPAPVLRVFEYNSIGAVGRNPWADQTAHSVRDIGLTEKEARFIADTVFWLDRIRAYSNLESEHDGFSSCTADGHAKTTMHPDHQPPRELASATIWAVSSISAQWKAEYTRETFANLAELLMSTGVPKHLGDRWNVAPEIDRQSLATPTGQRLAPRVDADARRQLTETFAAILDQHRKDPIPAAALEELIQAAGDETLTELLPALKELHDALPPESPEDKEFAALEKRFERDHFGNPLVEETPEHKKAYERYTALREKREFVPNAILRKPLSFALSRLRRAGNTADLMNAAADNAPDSVWALGQLHRIDPEAWSTIVASQFRNADKEARRSIFETLAAGNPAEAKRIIADITRAEHRDLIIEIAAFHQENDPAALAKDLPVLMEFVGDRKQNFIRRSQAMDRLAQVELPPEMRVKLIALLEKEIRDPQQGEYQMNTLDSAVRALTRIAGTADHLALITTTPAIANDAFEDGFAAILKMAGDRPDRQKILAGYLRQRFTKSPGMMNDVLLYALAHDLRDLAAEIAGFTSASPTETDGDGADYSGGNFKGPVGQLYHIAREISALWSENDPTTLGRMWAFFVAAHPYQFDHRLRDSETHQLLLDLAKQKIRSLPETERREAIDSAISRMRIPKYYSETETWLNSLRQN